MPDYDFTGVPKKEGFNFSGIPQKAAPLPPPEPWETSQPQPRTLIDKATDVLAPAARRITRAVAAPGEQANRAISDIGKGDVGGGAAGLVQAILGTTALPFTAGTAELQEIPGVGPPAVRAINLPFEAAGAGVRAGEQGIHEGLKAVGVNEPSGPYARKMGQGMSGLNQTLAQFLLPALAGKMMPGKVAPIEQRVEPMVEPEKPIVSPEQQQAGLTQPAEPSPVDIRLMADESRQIPERTTRFIAGNEGVEERVPIQPEPLIRGQYPPMDPRLLRAIRNSLRERQKVAEAKPVGTAGSTGELPFDQAQPSPTAPAPEIVRPGASTEAVPETPEAKPVNIPEATKNLPTAEEQIEPHRLSNMPEEIRASVKEEAQGLLNEAKGISSQKGGIVRTENDMGQAGPGKGDVVGRYGAVSTAPEWFKDLGRSKEDVIKNLQKIVEDDPKNALAIHLVDKIVEMKKNGRFEGRYQVMPGDEEFAGLYDAYREGTYGTGTTDFPAPGGEPLSLTPPPEGVAKPKPAPQEEMFTGEQAVQAKQPKEPIRSNIPMEKQVAGTMFEPKVEEGPAFNFEGIEKKEAPGEMAGSLQSGGVGELAEAVKQFHKQDVVPTIARVTDVGTRAVRVVTAIPRMIASVFQPIFPAMKKLGEAQAAEVIKGIHEPEKQALRFDNATSQSLDRQFNQLTSDFEKLPKKDLENFNLSRGTPATAEAMRLQQDAKAALPKSLQDPRLAQALKEASDYVFDYAQKNGIDLNYFEDYFYGAYKNPEQVGKFMDYWRSTEKYTKEKTLPTIADATAYGLELKDQNPVTNIKSEMFAVSKRVGLKHIDEYNAATNAPYAVKMSDATPEQVKTWQKINDPVFKDQLFDPLYAKYVNSLLSSNIMGKTALTRGMRSLSHGLQMVKFVGSIFHLSNMTKHAIAANVGGIANPKGVIDFAKAFKKFDAKDPAYQEYVGLGGGHQYSIEAQAQTVMSKALDNWKTGNIFGAALRVPIGLLQQKWLPASPGNVKWMFQDFIPTLKYDRFVKDVQIDEARLNRPLTDAEKITKIRTIQNFYGEMNERLFGRSGTVTSAMRLFFMAPGYGEGNIRTTAGSMNASELVSGKGAGRTNMKYVVNSLITTATLATVATRIMTGKWPDAPKRVEDVRDLFKAKTGAKDGSGDDVYVDLMTFDKDFWSIYGNAATGQPGKIGSEISSRVSGATSTGYRALTDLSTLFQGRMVYDYKGQPIWYSSDPMATKVGKFLETELGGVAPISAGVFGQSKQKGTGTLESVATAIAGLRPTTSEHVKTLKKARGDLFSMKDNRDRTQIEINKLANENPAEAEKKKNEFNRKQIETLQRILKEVGAPGVDPKSVERDYLISSMKIRPKGMGTEAEMMLRMMGIQQPTARVP